MARSATTIGCMLHLDWRSWCAWAAHAV